MSRPPAGSIDVQRLVDGSRAFHLRFRANGKRERVVLHERTDCECGCGGGWSEPSARNELGNIRARVRAGVWQRAAPPAPPVTPRPMPTFHEYASHWLQAKVDGVIGEKPIDPNTHADYRWRLCIHLLPFFARYRLDKIDRALCLAFKSHKLAESAQLREAIAAGAEIRDRRGRRTVPLSASSIRKLLDTLAAILDDAIEDEFIDRNPARGKRMRVRVPKPSRTFLETDELVALIDAAQQQEVAFVRPRPVDHNPESNSAAVARLLEAGLKASQIAGELGLARSTVSHHLRSLNAQHLGDYIGRRAVVELLGRSGVRASELCDMRIRDLRLHDPDGARFRIPDAKTPAGIREVQMSPDLVEAVIEHIDRLRRAGQPVDADAYLVPNLRGGRMSRQRVGEIVREAAQLASARNMARGLPALPHTTPHSLRRTYISLALLANNFDVKWVMSQVGHADSKMTLDVYAQLEQRAERSHGTSFDRLVRRAREQLHGHPQPSSTLDHWATNSPQTPDPARSPDLEPSADAEETTDLQDASEMARPRLELGTPRFSVVCSTN
jgi:integrase